MEYKVKMTAEIKAQNKLIDELERQQYQAKLKLQQLHEEASPIKVGDLVKCNKGICKVSRIDVWGTGTLSLYGFAKKIDGEFRARPSWLGSGENFEKVEVGA